MSIQSSSVNLHGPFKIMIIRFNIIRDIGKDGDKSSSYSEYFRRLFTLEISWQAVKLCLICNGGNFRGEHDAFRLIFINISRKSSMLKIDWKLERIRFVWHTALMVFPRSRLNSQPAERARAFRVTGLVVYFDNADSARLSCFFYINQAISWL